jgi:hypothetical protein
VDPAELANYHTITWWDSGMQMFIGICAEIPACLAQEPTQAGCEQSLREIAVDIVTFCLLYPVEPMPTMSALEARQVAISVWGRFARGGN